MAVTVDQSQFLRELHFIEAAWSARRVPPRSRRSSFGNCTSLRRLPLGYWDAVGGWSQFLRELHFIEASEHTAISSASVHVAVPSGAALH